jgi:carboxylate-amine ligase
MTTLIPFKKNDSLTVGVELEMQLVNLHTFNLTMEAEDFLRRMSEVSHPAEVKPEITQSMIEINSSIHHAYSSLLAELISVRNILAEEARKTHIGICGGGTHPFQRWKEQRIFQNERFSSVSEQYGYLAKQFTVFGQHIHIGCSNGDDALYLCHALARYMPHFIALSASSPFSQGVDTAFDCSRLAIISAFPLSGTPPWMLTWDEFDEYFNKLAELEVVTSMKDFYWDIRPKPEFGTIEIRIGDTPLTVEKSAELAVYAQTLVSWLLENRQNLSRDVYLTYLINRFRAARYGLNATIVDPIQNVHLPLAEDILLTCDQLNCHAIKLNNDKAIESIRRAATNKYNDANELRNYYEKLQSLPDVVRMQTEKWMFS